MYRKTSCCPRRRTRPPRRPCSRPAPPSATVDVGHVAGLGAILVTGFGRTLYMLPPGRGGTVSCTGAWPLYTYAGDVTQGQAPPDRGSTSTAPAGTSSAPPAHRYDRPERRRDRAATTPGGALGRCVADRRQARGPCATGRIPRQCRQRGHPADHRGFARRRPTLRRAPASGRRSPASVPPPVCPDSIVPPPISADISPPGRLFTACSRAPA